MAHTLARHGQGPTAALALRLYDALAGMDPPRAGGAYRLDLDPAGLAGYRSTLRLIVPTKSRPHGGGGGGAGSPETDGRAGRGSAALPPRR